MTERVRDNMSDLTLTAPPSPLTAPINAQNAGNNTDTNVDADNSRNIFESGTPTVAFNTTSTPVQNQPPSSSSTPVPPFSPSAQIVAQQKFLHQRRSDVRKQLHAYQTCHVKFTTLHLSSNNITDVQSIGDALKTNNTLKHLWLHDNNITDDSGIQSIIDVLKTNNTLRVLFLRDNQLSYNMRSQLDAINQYKIDGSNGYQQVEEMMIVT
eukprot:g4075.t1